MGGEFRVRVIREGFPVVQAVTCSADPAGTVYCLTIIGDRAAPWIVCRVSRAGTASCVELEGEALFSTDIAALSNGALIIAQDSRVARFDFPQ